MKNRLDYILKKSRYDSYIIGMTLNNSNMIYTIEDFEVIDDVIKLNNKKLELYDEDRNIIKYLDSLDEDIDDEFNYFDLFRDNIIYEDDLIDFLKILNLNNRRIKYLNKKYEVLDVNSIKFNIEKKENLYVISNYKDYKMITSDVVIIERNHEEFIFINKDANSFISSIKPVMNRELFINFINYSYMKNKDVFILNDKVKSEINYIDDNIPVNITLDKYMQFLNIRVKLKYSNGYINVYNKLSELYNILKEYMPYYIKKEIDVFDLNINIYDDKIYDFLNNNSKKISKLIDSNMDMNEILIKDFIKFLDAKIEYNVKKDNFILKLNKKATKYIKSILFYKRKVFSKVFITDENVFKITKNKYDELAEFLSTLFLNSNTLKEENELSKALIYNIFKSENKYIKYIDKKELEKIYKEIISYNPLSVDIPIELNETLRDYQKYGFRYLKMLDKYGFGGILADEMGLGKTLQVITFIKSLDKNKKVLIVCPKTLMFNWAREFDKFSKDINYQIINGTPKNRKLKIDDFEKFNVNITSYPLISKDSDLYKGIDYVFFDEMQMVKNYKAKSTIACRKLDAIKKYAVTGTPIENNVIELWSIFNIINPGYLGDLTNFKRTFHSNSNEKTDAILQESINHFLLKRHKKDVLKELPPKIIDEIDLSLTKSQRKEYDKLVESYKNKIEYEINTNGLNSSYITILSLLTRLRQVCYHPKLFLKDYNGDSSKLDQCLNIIREVKAENKKVLVFSNFKSLLDIIKEELDKESISNHYINGQTKEKDRQDMVLGFNDDDTNVFLLSIKAGGTGINLTAADTIILMDPWWNPQVESQAIDRAHRIGQKNTVQVIKLITIDTIEEKILEMQKRKLDIYNRVIKSDADILTKLSKEEILNLFNNK